MRTAPTPWYKVPHVWLVVLLPAITVIACIGFVIFAFKTSDNLVRDDWYMDGKTVRQDLGRDVLAANLGLESKMTLNDSGQLSLSLDVASADFTPTKKLDVNLIHATDKSSDVSTTLTLVGDVKMNAGKSQHLQYAGKLPKSNLIGKYYIELTDSNWRLRSEAEFPVTQLEFKPLEIYKNNHA